MYNMISTSFFFKALFFRLSRGKISQFRKEFDNSKGESLRNRLGRDVLGRWKVLRVSLGTICQIFPISAQILYGL